MTIQQRLAQQALIIKSLQVKKDINVEEETAFRINFIKERLILSGHHVLVLGISGGIDSTTAGRMAQIAVEELRQNNYPAHFIAVRLPYHIQLDESDAQKAIAFIKPDETVTLNIQAASDATLNELMAQNIVFSSDTHQDFILGNIKARQRMIMQYAIAGTHNGLVIGTDHAAEALMGFFTKFGDGACDLAPLTGLLKRQVRQIADFLNAPEELIHKCPTADLETLTPLKPDEDAHGLSYDEIDHFLAGETMSDNVYQRILKAYNATAHKRELPITPFSYQG